MGNEKGLNERATTTRRGLCPDVFTRAESSSKARASVAPSGSTSTSTPPWPETTGARASTLSGLAGDTTSAPSDIEGIVLRRRSSASTSGS